MAKRKLVKKKFLLNEEELKKFNLWEVFWHYIVSLRHIFKRKIQSKLPGIRVMSKYESTFFSPAGEPQHGCDLPEIESINYHIPNSKNNVEISIHSGNTRGIAINLVTEKEIKYYYNANEDSALVMFDDAIIEILATWLKTDKITDESNKVFSSYPAD